MTAQGDSIRARLVEIISKNTGSPCFARVDYYLASRDISDISTLDSQEKAALVEGLLAKIVQPFASISKTALIRIELLSALEVKVDSSRGAGKVEVIATEPPPSVAEPASAITINREVSPGPADHRFEVEMRGEFKKVQDELLGKVAKTLTDTEKADSRVKSDTLTSIVTETFGQLGRVTLRYMSPSGTPGEGAIRNVVGDNLSSYMAKDKADESANGFMRLANMIFKTEDVVSSEKVDKGRFSHDLKDFFKDTNQVLLRGLRNRQRASSSVTTSDRERNEVMLGMMLYYFGVMSKQYLDVAIEKLALDSVDPADEKRKSMLMAAIIFDCLKASMSKEDAEEAYNNIKIILE